MPLPEGVSLSKGVTIRRDWKQLMLVAYINILQDVQLEMGRLQMTDDKAPKETRA